LILPRPLNGLITMLSVAVGALMAGISPLSFPALVAAFSAGLINGAGNAFNDLMDQDIDRINRPGRPLPSGRLSPRSAALESLVLALAGCSLAWYLGPVHGLLALAVSTLLVIYSIYLKNSMLWGNITIGALSAVAFPYGALVSGGMGRSWIPAVFALLFHLGREIVKDIEDMEGDRLRGERTLPLRQGRGPAAWVATAVYLVLIAFTWIPWAIEVYGMVYVLAVSSVDGLLLYALFQLHRRGAQLSDDRLGRLLKAGMLLGLLAILAGELAPR
jgi:geranylgeranylglycerol-phosphate geranylgeranyltransferase